MVDLGAHDQPDTGAGSDGGEADFEHLPPEQLAADILQKELRIAEVMREIVDLLGRKP